MLRPTMTYEGAKYKIFGSPPQKENIWFLKERMIQMVQPSSLSDTI